MRLARRTARRPKLVRQTVDYEALLLFQLNSAQLPKPETQLAVVTGRKFVWDLGWRQFRLLIEVQGGIWRRGGGAHSHPTNILRDVEKQQLAVLNGWWVFPVTTDEVKRGEALRLIEIALTSKGWKP